MARITRKTITGFIWIPRPYEYKYEVKIERSGATDTITSDVIKMEWNKPVTEEVGKFSLYLNNNEGTYTDLYSGGEKIAVYLDWLGSSPNTLIFKGIIETLEKAFDYTYGNYFKIKGSHISGALLDLTVTEEYTNVAAHTILSNIINTYATDFTDSNVESTGAASTAITVKWSEKPFWQCVKDICTMSGCDAYVDDNYDFHFFEKNSKETTMDAVVWEDNLLEVKGLAKDTTEVYNKITVYGKDANSLPIIATAEDTSSQATYGVKQKIISDNSISSMVEAQDRANAELAADTSLKGSAKCLGMTYVQPGDLIWISDPVHSIHDQYRVYNIKDRLDKGYFTTEIQIENPSKALSLTVRKNREKSIALETITNPNRMLYSYNFEFDSDSGTHSDTEISGGKLKLQTGKTSGTWTSPVKLTSDTVTDVELRFVGQDLDSSTFYASADNGSTWDALTADEKKTLTNSGTQLELKVNLVSNSLNPNPQVDSCVLLYKG